MRINEKVTIDIESGLVLERESYEYAGPVVECRGENKAGAAAAEAARKSAEATNQQLLGERREARGYLLPRFQQFYDQPGFSSGEKTAITGESMGALGSAYGSAQDALERRAARTRNTAGVVEGIGEMGREKGREASGIARRNEIDFANRAREDKLTALQGMGSLYGIDTNLLARLSGLPVEYINAQTQALKGRPGFWETLGNAFGGALGEGLGKGASGQVFPMPH